MAKEAVFTMKLEPALRAEFVSAAIAAHRPASQVVRELMREFIKRQHDMQGYDDFFRRKGEAARTSLRAGIGGSNDEIEAEFDAQCTGVVSKV